MISVDCHLSERKISMLVKVQSNLLFKSVDCRECVVKCRISILFFEKIVTGYEIFLNLMFENIY